MAWLVREGDVLASAEVARGFRRRAVGLLGRDRESVTGALVLRPGRQIHTLGMRFPLDVAFCDSEGLVLRVATLPARRVSRPVWKAGFVVEARAGAKAPECAGVIHSDLQRGFIRAEVIRWDELLSIGSWNRAKEQGKLRVEGKEYEVADGDVLEIRFNV